VDTPGRTAAPACELPDLTPEVYARWRASDLGATTERLERRLVLARMGEVTDRAVLEIGCGDGHLAVKLAQMGANVSAIDASTAMVSAARERAGAHGADINIMLGEAQELPFPDEAFDLVVAVTILCFVEHASPVFKEIARVLKPGGHLVIGELGRWSTWAAERRVRAWLGSRLWQRGFFRTPGDLRELARSAGLRPLSVEGAVYYPRSAWAARHLEPFDRRLSRLTTVGAAFLVLKANKPE
jgi:ubiquinone/menaquinone biosynthesis C-methylase UbiE